MSSLIVYVYSPTTVTSLASGVGTDIQCHFGQHNHEVVSVSSQRGWVQICFQTELDLSSCFGLSWDSPSLSIEMTHGAMAVFPVYLRKVNVSEYFCKTGFNVGVVLW